MGAGSNGGGQGPQVAETTVASARVLDVLEPGSTTGVGSLPHRDAAQAVDFAFDAYDLPAIPSLPSRSPAESAIAQAVVGAAGVTLGQYGTIAVDVDRLDPNAPVDTDLQRDNFVGFRTFLEAAANRRYDGPIKWQFVGPISVGVALRRAGASPDLAFAVSVQAVSGHLRALSAAVSRALPNSRQLVVLDEVLAQCAGADRHHDVIERAASGILESFEVAERRRSHGKAPVGCDRFVPRGRRSGGEWEAGTLALVLDG